MVDASGYLVLGEIKAGRFLSYKIIEQFGGLKFEQPVSVDRVGQSIVVSDWLNYRACFFSATGGPLYEIGYPGLSRNKVLNAKLGSSSKSIITCHRTGAFIPGAMNNSRFLRFLQLLKRSFSSSGPSFQKINGVCSVGSDVFFSDKNQQSVVRLRSGSLKTKNLGARVGNIKAYEEKIYVCVEALRCILVLDVDLNIIDEIAVPSRPFTLSFHANRLYYGGLDGLFARRIGDRERPIDELIAPLDDVHGLDVFGSKLLVSDRVEGLYISSL